jgi:hypothetical protein
VNYLKTNHSKSLFHTEGRLFLTLLLFLFFAVTVTISSHTSVLAGDALIASGASDRTGLTLTVYNNNLALVKDSRRLSLPEGEMFLRFDDVSPNLDPSSVTIHFPDSTKGINVLEQQYLYDVVDPQKLLESYIGREVILVERREDSLEDKRTEATLLSISGGNVYRIGKEVHLGHPGRLVLPGLQDSLILKPALGWLLSVDKAAKQEVEVSYLATGLNWKAYYTLYLKPDESPADLTARIYVDNQGGSDFPEANLKLVAGEPQRIPSEPVHPRFGLEKAEMMAPAAPAPPVQERSLFEYHLYEVQRPVSLLKNQTKAITLFSVHRTNVHKEFVFRPQRVFWSGPTEEREEQKAEVTLLFTNDKKAGLGMPMPGGKVQIYQEDEKGSLQFVGEDQIEHTPEGGKIKLKAGLAFDVEMERKQTHFEQLGPRTIQQAFEIKLKNSKPREVEVTLLESLSGDWKIEKSSHTWKQTDYSTIEFKVAIPAKETATITYTVISKK